MYAPSWHYIVTSSLIGWAHTQNDPWGSYWWWVKIGSIDGLIPLDIKTHWSWDNTAAQLIFLNRNLCILINILPKFVTNCSNDDKSSLVQIMVWCRIGAKPLSKMMIPNFIVRRAGLLWSQQDFEWRWSVPLFKCLTVLEFSFILFDLCLLITFFQFYYELCTYCNILDIYLS